MGAILPRSVADKSRAEALGEAIEMALKSESAAVRRNTQTFNRGRYVTTGLIADYQTLKDQARAIKEAAIEAQPDLVRTLAQAVEANGGHFYIAKDAAEARAYIQKVCTSHQAKMVVKAKSMTSEEIKLNPALEAAGFEVVETDLAEFILQYADEQPSHIVGPAIHKSREKISALFQEVFHPSVPLETGEDLTAFARSFLRPKFLSADIGITGANIIAADSGTLVLVESEANIRLTTLLPSVHIALAGIEKIVPTRQDLIPFIELLAPSATGQPLSSYTHVIQPPLQTEPFTFDGKLRPPREFHLVILDNGRTAMREDPVLREALYCIRCSACLNVCANFQAVGGHAFGGETYSGGIGGAWEAGTRSLQHATFSDLCTGCSRCVPQCPVRIDIPWLNENLRSRLTGQERSLLSWIYKGFLPSKGPDKKASMQKQFLGNFGSFAQIAAILPGLSNALLKNGMIRKVLNWSIGLSDKRQLPIFTRSTFTKLARKRYPGKYKAQPVKGDDLKVLVIADVYTHYNYAARGMATLEILDRLGIEFAISPVLPSGRGALSQGMIPTARQRASKFIEYLRPYVEAGYDIITLEPSILALLRRDYEHLIDDPLMLGKLKDCSYDLMEFIEEIANRGIIQIDEAFRLKSNQPKNIFLHPHCQQKTIGADGSSKSIFEAIGFSVQTSDVECCGMAGSFGYKSDYYDLSMRVGEDLFGQIARARAEDKATLVVTQGISCHDQIRDGLAIKVYHPSELLADMLRPTGLRATLMDRKEGA